MHTFNVLGIGKMECERKRVLSFSMNGVIQVKLSSVFKVIDHGSGSELKVVVLPGFEPRAASFGN